MFSFPSVGWFYIPETLPLFSFTLPYRLFTRTISFFFFSVTYCSMVAHTIPSLVSCLAICLVFWSWVWFGSDGLDGMEEWIGGGLLVGLGFILLVSKTDWVIGMMDGRVDGKGECF